ncbi:hypothetical protein AVEN_84848-1, partial [Araneus ventricosus]
FRLVIITFHFEATRGFFWDGSRHFEQWSDDEDDISAGTSSPNFRTTPAGGLLALKCILTSKCLIRGRSSWNQVSNLEPFAPEAETLPLGNRDQILVKTFGLDS